MSAEELSKLSLGGTMVTTRAGASRAQSAPVQQHQSQSQPPSNSPSPAPSPSHSASPAPSLIESAAGLKYNVAAFDHKVRRRAKRGLMDNNTIKMKYCKLLDSDRNQYLFYLDDEIQIAMGGKYTVPKCTCGANEEGVACKHLFWMLDQLTSEAPPMVKAQTLQLAEDGSAIQALQRPEDASSLQDLKPAEIIKRLSLETVADNLDWVVYDGPIPEDEDIEEEVAEMLSVFEPSGALPGEFKRHETGALSERSSKYKEFKDLITELFTLHANKNLGLFDRLQNIVDAEFQAYVFFEKINDRIFRVFRALEEYIAYGPTAASSEAYDVNTCAGKLRALVKAINDYCHQQHESGHDMKETATRAAAALIKILDGVTSRNRDVYANITWAGIPPEDPKENNLFVCLIGAPTDEGLFVLDVLQSLPQDDLLRNHWETLHNINERLKPQWTPEPFLEAFRGITTETRKRAASDTASGGSSAKRSMQ